MSEQVGELPGLNGDYWRARMERTRLGINYINSCFGPDRPEGVYKPNPELVKEYLGGVVALEQLVGELIDPEAREAALQYLADNEPELVDVS